MKSLVNLISLCKKGRMITWQKLERVKRRVKIKSIMVVYMVDRRRNRLVKDIDSALNQSNHDLLLIPSKTEEIGVELEKNKSTTKKIF